MLYFTNCIGELLYVIVNKALETQTLNPLSPNQKIWLYMYVLPPKSFQDDVM